MLHKILKEVTKGLGLEVVISKANKNISTLCNSFPGVMFYVTLENAEVEIRDQLGVRGKQIPLSDPKSFDTIRETLKKLITDTLRGGLNNSELLQKKLTERIKTYTAEIKRLEGLDNEGDHRQVDKENRPKRVPTQSRRGRSKSSR